MTKSETAVYMVNKTVHGVRAGTKMTLRVDKDGVPLEKQWRRRLRDAKIDNCISLVEEKAPAEKPKKKPAAGVDKETL